MRIAAVMAAVFKADTSDLKRGLSEADNAVKKTGDGARAAGTIAFGILAAEAARAALNVGRDMVSMGMQTENGLNVFREVANASADDMKRVQKQAIDLGRDMALPGQSAADATTAMLELAKAGLDVDTTLGAARGTMLLAAAANIDSGKAAQFNANALNAFNLPGSEAIRVADLLAGAANASSGEITDMALALQMSSAVFGAAGVPIEDLSTSIALMANRGIIGSDAGTSLKSMLLTMQTPSKKAKELMDDLGLSLYDSSGNMKSMREIIGNLQTSMVGLTQEQKDTALGTIFGSDAIRSANVLLAEGVEGFDAMSVKVNEAGSAQSIATARTEGLQGALGAVSKTIKTQLLIAYLALAPAITKVVRGFAEFLPKAFEAMGAAWDAVGRPAMDAIRAAIDWLKENPEIAAAVIGVLAGAIGGVLVGAIVLATAAMWALVAPILAALLPFVLIGAAIGGLVAILIYSYNHFEGFRELVDKTMEMSKRAFEKLIEVTHKLADWWKEMWPGIENRLQKAWDKMRPMLEKMGALFESVFGAIKAIVETTVAIITEIWDRMHERWWNTVQGIWDAIVGYLSGAFESITEIFGGLYDTLSGVFDLIKAILTGKWGEAWDAIVKIVKGVGATLAGAIRFVMDGVVAVFKLAWEGIKFVFETALAIISAVWSFVWNAMSTLLSDIWGFITGVIDGAWEKIKGFFNAGKEAITTVWSATWNGAKDLVTGVFDKIVGIAGDLWTRIKNSFGSFKDKLTGFFRESWDAALATGSDFSLRLVEIIRSLPTRFKVALVGVADTIAAPFKAAFNSIANFWNKTVGSLNFTVPSWIPGLGGKSWDVPDIPTFATGAFVRMPTLAVIGDSPGGEWAIPEGKADAFAAARMRAKGLDGGGSQFNVTINGTFGEPITERGLARKFVELEAMVNA